MEVCRCGRHIVWAGTKSAGCTKMAPEQQEWNVCGVIIQSNEGGTSSSTQVGVSCACARVNVSAWRPFNAAVVCFSD